MNLPQALRNFKKTILPLGLSVLGAFSFQAVRASTLVHPFSLPSTEVLPEGRGSPQFKNIRMELLSQFTDNGLVEPIGAALYQPVTWTQLIDFLGDPTEKAMLEAILNDGNLSPQDGPGTTTGQVNMFADVKVPILAYGITKDLTVALAIPVYTIDVSVASAFYADPNSMTAFFNQVSTYTSPAQAASIQSRMGNLQDAVNIKLLSMGYEPLRTKTIQSVGDMRLIGKTPLHRSRRDMLTLQTTITLPTGTPPDPDDVIDVPTGDGQTDIEAALVYQYKFDRNWFVKTSGAYNYQFADSIVRRIPENSLSILSADKELVDRKLGDTLRLGASLGVKVRRIGMTFEGGYTYQYQQAVQYQGTAFEQSRYRLLEQQTPQQILHSGTLAATFSTIDWYRRGQFVYPFQVGFVYSRALAGFNAKAADDLFAGEVVVFF